MYPFLFLLTGIIGVVTIIVMATSYKSNPFCNAYLLIAIFIVSFRFLVHGSFEMGLQEVIKPLEGKRAIFYLIIIPCFYLYHKCLALQLNTYDLKELKHLVFIVVLYIINMNGYLVTSFIFSYLPIINFNLINLFLIFYSVLIYKVLSKNLWFKKDLLISNKHFKLIKNWTAYLFTINILTLITLIISFYNELHNQSNLSGKSFAVFSLFFWLFIYFKILFTPEILFGLPILNKKLIKFSSPLAKSTDDQKPISDNWILESSNQKNEQDLKLQKKIISSITSYINEIDKLSIDDHVFRNANVSTSDLAAKLGVPTSHIVYLFKYHSKISFSEYRTLSRINDSINLINKGFLKNNTLEALAYKTGFASYNPFFSAFKKVTAFSPQDYLKLNKTTIEG